MPRNIGLLNSLFFFVVTFLTELVLLTVLTFLTELVLTVITLLAELGLYCTRWNPVVIPFALLSSHIFFT